MTTSFYIHLNVFFTDLLIILHYVAYITNNIVEHIAKKHKLHGHEFPKIKTKQTGHVSKINLQGYDTVDW